MTPMDVIKQRLQLGYDHNSLSGAVGTILREQGARAFVVSLPLTLTMNLPYAAIMGMSNEMIRKRLCPDGAPTTTAYMTAGACSGAIAAAATMPLDAVKTRLQTQHLSTLAPGDAAAAAAPIRTLPYTSALQASAALYQEGGVAIFYRGVMARVLVHAPSVGICWTSYELAKRLLERSFGTGVDTVATTRSPLHDSTEGRAPPATASADRGSAAPKELPFVDHMIAGSLAGIAEHVAVFPIDTVKTHIQAAPAEVVAANGTIGTARHIIRQHGVTHLFRGLSALLPAIGPAHALMFSGYEQVLSMGGAKDPNASPERVAVVGGAAGVISTLLHDSCMVPAETMKQRLQLGYYRDALHCAQAMLATGGGSFFRSLPTTLAMNVPYASLMMMGNESVKKWLNPSGEFNLSVYFISAGLSGSLAAGCTTPLDVVKTRLQVQNLSGGHNTIPYGAAPGDAFVVRYNGFVEAVRSIHAESGFGGFWRGLGPRVAMFGPSCAISWVAYESCKEILLSRHEEEAWRA